MARVLLGAAIGSHAQEETDVRIPEIDAPIINPQDIDMDSQSFVPREIIDHPLCRMGTGARWAADLAVVAMPKTAGGIRFAVLDGTGTVFDGELSFFPNNYALGKRKDGSVLVGFGGQAKNREAILRPDARRVLGPVPVRIYRDGGVIFETDQAWQFGIASNGTSFFVTQPQVKRTPKRRIEPMLTIINTTSGRMDRFDIVDQVQDIIDAYGNPITERPTSIYSQHERSVTYSISEDEIMIAPKHRPRNYTGSESDQILFYPVAKGHPRFSVFNHVAALFASSRHGYFADRCGGDPIFSRSRAQRDEITVVKKRFDWSDIAEKTETVIWSRTIDLDRFSRLGLSDDGAYLILEAINLHVLNAATGETVFAFPVPSNLSSVVDGEEYHWTWDRAARERRILRDHPVGRTYYDAALKRLTNVLPPGSTINDIELGGPLTIRQGRLAMTHRIAQGADGNADNKEFLYLFDMNDIEPNDKPGARVELAKPGWSNACVRGNVPEQGLQVRGGKLTYLTERLSFDTD